MSDTPNTDRPAIPRAHMPTREQKLRQALFADEYDIDELAAALEVGWRTIYAYMRQGCPYNKIGTRRTFNPERVKQWMIERQAARQAPRPVGRPRKAQK